MSRCSHNGAVVRVRLAKLRRSAASVGALVLCTGASFADAPSAAGSAGERTPPRYLSLNSVEAYLELRGEYHDTRVRVDARDRFARDFVQKNRDLEIRETLGLRFDLTVVDPSVLAIAGEFGIGLVQSRFREETNTSLFEESDTGHLLRYDLRADLFRGNRLSGSIFALRDDDRINRRFQPTLDQERLHLGTSWVLADERFPMEVSYEYLETDRTGNRDSRNDEHYTNESLTYRADWIVSRHHRLELLYEHARSRQEFQGIREAFETTRDLWRIEHEVEFGEDFAHRLSTRVHWQEESGDFARDFIRIGPRLTLKHSDSLQTVYEYQFNRERYEGLDVESQRVDFQIIHQLYTNLTTTVDVFALYEDVENDINTLQYGGAVDWQYNRRNDFGRFYGNLALAYDTEDVEGDDGRKIVLDETHTFRDPVGIVLRQRAVVTRSIVVTDTSNRRFFLKGVDYFVTRRGHATILTRARTGAIADGDTVLVDYQHATPQDGKLDTVRVDLSLEQRFSGGLRPYYRWSYRNQEDQTSAGFRFAADRTDHHRAGVEYEQDRYALGVEYEIFDDSVDPYDAFHVNGRVSLIRSVERTLDAAARISRLFFEGGIDDRNVTLIDVEVDHRWQLMPSLSTVERVAFRWEDDSVAGLTHAWDVVAGLEYVWGDLSGELTFEYDRLSLPGSRDDDYGVFLRVRREFRDVLARR